MAFKCDIYGPVFSRPWTDRSQRVVLNHQWSNWQPILAGVPQEFILGPSFFLIYINDLSDGLKSNVKLFADDTSFFSVAKNKEESANYLTNDVDMISKWACNWKMSFNPDPGKSAQEILLSRKNSYITHPIIHSTMFRYKELINKGI